MSFDLPSLLLAAHVAVSLVGITTGPVVVYGFLAGKRLDLWNAVFLATTILTSVSGYFLPADRLLPSHVVGAVSLVVLAVALVARYARSWPRVYAVAAVTALYLNCFVLVVQLFQKVPALTTLAPTQSEPPFQIAQLVLLLTFLLTAIAVAVRGRAAPVKVAVNG
jgi:hypothetical protein